MRFKSKKTGGYQVFAVTGTNTRVHLPPAERHENMLAIRGNQRVADIYFTEFNRIFYHYYFRSVQEQTKKLLDKEEKKRSDQQTLFLSESDDWVKKYKAGSLKRKRVDIFRRIEGFAS